VTDSLQELAKREVVALHEFFVGWFRGELAESAFASCEDAFAADFRMVTPEGAVHEREAIVARLRAARGRLPPDFSVDVIDPNPFWSAGDAVLLEYVERQYRDGRTTRRRSTALFTSEPSAPRGVYWRHLQETWIGGMQNE
jgi:hypothetical protein